MDQNQHWHSNNPAHLAVFWEHKHFHDRCNLFEVIKLSTSTEKT
jgi:hypothetical protein